jgi:hypothetical protein
MPAEVNDCKRAFQYQLSLEPPSEPQRDPVPHYLRRDGVIGVEPIRDACRELWGIAMVFRIEAVPVVEKKRRSTLRLR